MYSSSKLNELADALRARGWFLVTAESCTGGGIAQRITEQAGSSTWFEGGFVTYADAAKVRMLGVKASMIAASGAVSEAVACAMAEGALAHSQAHLGVATTGIAGPGGGSAAKPVGTVWIAWAKQGRPAWAQKYCFSGDRAEVRAQTIAAALDGLKAALVIGP